MEGKIKSRVTYALRTLGVITKNDPNRIPRAGERDTTARKMGRRAGIVNPALASYARPSPALCLVEVLAALEFFCAGLFISEKGFFSL